MSIAPAPTAPSTTSPVPDPSGAGVLDPRDVSGSPIPTEVAADGPGPLRRTWWGSRPRGAEDLAEEGMSTAEYAVGIMAACTFALVLLGVVRSDTVREALANLVAAALGLAG